MTEGVEGNQREGDGRGWSDKLSEFAVSRFMEIFLALCRSPEEMAQLMEMKDAIVLRWGEYGLDMVSAFKEKYKNLDFQRLRSAVQAFVNSSSQDVQHASEEFWWLMGVGKGEIYADLLADNLRFETFRRLMEEQGLEPCKMRADQIRARIMAEAGLQE